MKRGEGDPLARVLAGGLRISQGCQIASAVFSALVELSVGVSHLSYSSAVFGTRTMHFQLRAELMAKAADSAAPCGLCKCRGGSLAALMNAQ